MSVFLLAVRTDHRTLKTIQKTVVYCVFPCGCYTKRLPVCSTCGENSI